MQVYAVGGAVRDALLGLPVKDHDYVVVGATPEQMLAQGFRPVGRDFPVFLHPKTHEEYALARTERKSGHGYHGFAFHAAPDVTLEEDLARRDLTVNAIARDGDGRLIDPFNGCDDLQAKRLRHVGPAFVEDPVRILRVARFAARFPDFTIAEETLALMKTMVSAGEADHLVAERVWQELAKGLMTNAPSRMFSVLDACGALSRLLPELSALHGIPQRAEFHPEGDVWAHTLLVIDAAARAGLTLPERWAAVLHDIGKAKTSGELLPRHPGHEQCSAALAVALSERLRAPADCRDLAVLAARWHGVLHRSITPGALAAGEVLEVLEQTDAFRRPARFTLLLNVATADFTGRAGRENDTYPALDFWTRSLAAAQSVDAASIAKTSSDGSEVGAAIHAARMAAIAAELKD